MIWQDTSKPTILGLQIKQSGFKQAHLDNIHALRHSAKHSMLVIQPWCCNSSYEELRAICIWPCICHGKSEGPIVP